MTQYVESTLREGELFMRKPNAIRTRGVLASALVPLVVLVGAGGPGSSPSPTPSDSRGNANSGSNDIARLKHASASTGSTFSMLSPSR